MTYQFSATLYRHQAPGGWWFLALPKTVGQQIRSIHSKEELGWGRLKVWVSIEGAEWGTSIWFDRKAETYLLPIKSSVRTEKDMKDGDTVAVTIRI